MLRHVCGRALSALVLGIVLAGCGQNSNIAQNLPTPDGITAQPTSQFAAVVMVILPGGTGLCSGTFISPNAVLTAAHCSLTSGEYQVIASFGTFTTSNVVHFGPGQVDDPNDIALLIFSQNVASASQGQVYNIGTSVSVGNTLRLVGFGCDDVSSRDGAGVKRTGTNVVESIDDYLEFQTPLDSTNSGSTGTTQALEIPGGAGKGRIIGPDNLAGSCFGDSGGPAINEAGGTELIVGVTHAGGANGSVENSEYVDLTRSDNQGWLTQMNSQYSLGIQGL